MHDLTHVYKGLAGFIISLICAYAALVYVGLIYGREIGQEQSKLSKRLNIPVKKLGLRGFWLWQWSSSNRLDYYGALTGSILGAILWFSYIKPLWSI